jgi:hypothetical protein
VSGRCQKGVKREAVWVTPLGRVRKGLPWVVLVRLAVARRFWKSLIVHGHGRDTRS